MIDGMDVGTPGLKDGAREGLRVGADVGNFVGRVTGEDDGTAQVAPVSDETAYPFTRGVLEAKKFSTIDCVSWSVVTDDTTYAF